MIQKISIQDYRSCLDTTFELRPNLSVLIGPNSSGKTNILNALLLLRKLAEVEPLMRHGTIVEATGQCKLKVWFDLNGKKAILSAVVDIFTDENNRDVVVSSDQQWYAKDFIGTGRRIGFPIAFAQESSFSVSTMPLAAFKFYARSLGQKRISSKPPLSIVEPLRRIGEGLKEMRYYSASQFTNPSNCPVSFEIETEGTKSRSIGAGGHTRFLEDLYKSSKSSENTDYEQFYDIIGPQGIGLVDSVEFQEIPISSVEYSVRSGGRYTQLKREKILVIPQFVIGKNILSPNQLSEGTFKTITLIFYLITEASNILLLEEPEVCVHHGLLSSIIELIKTYSRDKQIVISTHSDFVLDQVQPEDVYKVTNLPGKGTKVSHIPNSMSRRELSALREYLETEGNLGEYWRHGRLE